MERVGNSDTTIERRDNSEWIASAEEHGRRAARELLDLARSPAQRSTIALIGLAAFEREIAQAVQQ